MLVKCIWNVFKTDIKKIFRRKIAVVILGGLLIIPGIYAWLNIDSNWNPYDNTGNLPIAIVNKDQGVTMMEEQLNMGDLMVKSLKENDAMKWIFTDEQTARENIDKSIYYGEIVIPEDFSSKVVTLFDGAEIQKPEFEFYVNQKKNPIAPIIVNKAVTTIQNSLNQNFVNAIIYKVINTAEDIDIITKGVQTTDELIDKLKQAKKNIAELRAVTSTMALASDSTSNSLNAVRDLLPSVENIMGTSKQGISDMRDAVQSFSAMYDNMSGNVENVMKSVEDIGKELEGIAEGTDSSNITENLDMMTAKLDSLEKKLKSLQDTLSKINDVVEISKINEWQEDINKTLKDIENLKKMIENSKETVEDLDQVKEKTKQLSADIVNVNKVYQESIKDDLNSAYSNASKSMSNVTNLVSSLNVSLGKTDSAMVHMISALDNTRQLTDNIDIVLLGMQADIDKIIESLSGPTETEMYAKIANLLSNDPNDVADFLSTPIETNEIDIYEIESYGSKMAPFYTILACWVGCTLLVSLLRTDIKETPETRNLKNYQKFFGRFMLFGIMATLQGLIIGIGDIVLKVQVLNVPLFLLVIMLASFVFMLLVYSLVISFGKVGSAAAIVLMVLQVAGSGGTFPIELLPRLFQILQPFMPFYPAMSALRETIGGFYGNTYILSILGLLAHTIIPLLLGLCFRNSIINIKEKVDEELEKTDIIV